MTHCLHPALPTVNPPSMLKSGWLTSTALSLHQEAGTIFRAQVVTCGLNYLSLLHQGSKETNKKSAGYFFVIVVVVWLGFFFSF